MKLKKEVKLLISCDGGAASGKTTGAKLVSRKYGLKFLSSGMLYRLASYELLKKNPKNKIFFLKKLFKNLDLKKLNNINLHSAEVSENTSIIAKEKKIRIILKSFQKICPEGKFLEMMANADVVSIVNWTMIPKMTSILVELVDRVLPNLPPRDTRSFFFDLTEFSIELDSVCFYFFAGFFRVTNEFYYYKYSLSVLFLNGFSFS